MAEKKSYQPLGIIQVSTDSDLTYPFPARGQISEASPSSSSILNVMNGV